MSPPPASLKPDSAPPVVAPGPSTPQLPERMLRDLEPRGRLKRIALILVAAVLLVGVFFVQDSMNHDREVLDLTRVQPLENAPPVLAFCTVALGGFRGLISNLLWTRANELQEEDKFFEMAQLADWITKLEPHFAQVWIFQAWNMAWNISVKFTDYADRWRWLRRGLELLRDEGLKYNPNDVLLYRELAWIFQDKMGAFTDDANMYYKEQWVNQMSEVFPTNRPDFDALIHPRTPDEIHRAAMLRDKYKLDPEWMKEVDNKYGPLEWRLPEAHAIYWATLGLRQAERNPTKINKEDLTKLHRVIYQSMQLAFQRGRIEMNPITGAFGLGPNLENLSKVSDSYEEWIKNDEPMMRENVATAHRNFLRQAVYYLYINNRIPEAARWFKYLGEKYPDKTIIDGDPNSYPSRVTLDDYAIACVQEDINDTSPSRTESAIEGLLTTAYMNLVIGQDQRAAGFQALARKVWQTYEEKIPEKRKGALDLRPMKEINQEVLNRLLDPKEGWPAEYRAILRSKLALPAETTTGSTDAAPPAIAAPTPPTPATAK
jgi:hypothetical protein